MFRKVLQSISRSFQSAKRKTAEQNATRGSGGVLDRVVKDDERHKIPSTARKGEPTAEELCEIPPKCGKEEVAARLKLLYRRYNRGAASLDANMRVGSERMLDAIVEVREKYFGHI